MGKLGAIAAVLLLVLVLYPAGGGPAGATTLAPAYGVSLSSSSPGANANITLDYWADSPDALETHHVTFIPAAFGVANDAAVTNGAKVGLVLLSVTESRSNGNCGEGSFLSMDLLDATTDTNNTLPDTPRIPDPGWPGFADTNSNGLPDAVDKYPTFLKNLFPGLTPRSRAYAGDTDGSGVKRVVNVLVFDPGTALPGMSPIDASLGYIEVVVLQDPTAPPVAGSLITDSCTPFHIIRQELGKTSDNLATPGNEGNQVYRTNPASDGTYTFMEYGRTIRDLDSDGIENTLDSCPSVSTPSWNPRVNDFAYDPDLDGIPGQDDFPPGEQLKAGTGCDPTPLTNTNAGDHDGDGFLNRQDNCPLVANPTQADSDGDGIGDACDTVPVAPDGHLHEVCVTADVVVGAGGPPAAPACPEFVLDMDNDGYDKATEQHVGTNTTDPCGNDGWPADLVGGIFSENRVNIQDLGSYLGPVRYINTNVGTNPGDVRWDVVPGRGGLGNDINIIDLGNIVSLKPPMFGGASAFNGPSCPYPP
jgi:hypothetical protein